MTAIPFPNDLIRHISCNSYMPFVCVVYEYTRTYMVNVKSAIVLFTERARLGGQHSVSYAAHDNLHDEQQNHI